MIGYGNKPGTFSRPRGGGVDRRTPAHIVNATRELGGTASTYGGAFLPGVGRVETVTDLQQAAPRRPHVLTGERDRRFQVMAEQEQTLEDRLGANNYQDVRDGQGNVTHSAESQRKGDAADLFRTYEIFDNAAVTDDGSSLPNGEQADAAAPAPEMAAEQPAVDPTVLGATALGETQPYVGPTNATARGNGVGRTGY